MHVSQFEEALEWGLSELSYQEFRSKLALERIQRKLYWTCVYICMGVKLLLLYRLTLVQIRFGQGPWQPLLPVDMAIVIGSVLLLLYIGVAFSLPHFFGIGGDNKNLTKEVAAYLQNIEKSGGTISGFIAEFCRRYPKEGKHLYRIRSAFPSDVDLPPKELVL